MNIFSFNTKIWLYRKPIDFRKQTNGLVILVSAHLNEDPTSGHVYVFRNRSGDRVKLLYWEGNGFWLMYKKLERDRFKFPSIEDAKFEINGEQLQWLLSGLDIMQIEARNDITASNFF